VYIFGYLVLQQLVEKVAHHSRFISYWLINYSVYFIIYIVYMVQEKKDEKHMSVDIGSWLLSSFVCHVNERRWLDINTSK